MSEDEITVAKTDVGATLRLQGGEFAALITGSIAGALLKATGKDGHLLIDVNVPRDTEGNYLHVVEVTGRESGEKLVIRVETVRE